MSAKITPISNAPSARGRRTRSSVSPSLQEFLDRAAAVSQQLLDEQMAEAGFRPRRRSRGTTPRREEG